MKQKIQAIIDSIKASGSMTTELEAQLLDLQNRQQDQENKVAFVKNKKIIYKTHWTTAVGNTKEYPHGWGFDAPLVEFPQDADPAWCVQMCMKYLSNEEFECYGATPQTLFSGNFAFEYPTDAKSFDDWKKVNKYL